jgi:hypothetical protein
MHDFFLARPIYTTKPYWVWLPRPRGVKSSCGPSMIWYPQRSIVPCIIDGSLWLFLSFPWWLTWSHVTFLVKGVHQWYVTKRLNHEHGARVFLEEGNAPRSGELNRGRLLAVDYFREMPPKKCIVNTKSWRRCAEHPFRLSWCWS